MPAVSEALPLGEKPVGYYGQERESLVRELPTPLGRVLDVGCGEGGANAPLRAAGATEITGVEIQPVPAAKLRLNFSARGPRQPFAGPA